MGSANCPPTMGNGFPATGHNAITKLNDLWDTDNLLGVVTLIWQEHQEEKYVGNDGFWISVTGPKTFIVRA